VEARGMGRGAAVCEAVDPVTGNSVCPLLRCRGAGPPEWVVVVVVGDLGSAPFSATVQVDGGGRHTVPLEPTGRSDMQEAAGTVNLGRDRGLLAELRSGRCAGGACGAGVGHAAVAARIGPQDRARAGDLPGRRGRPAARGAARHAAGRADGPAVHTRIVGARIVHVTSAGEAGFFFRPDGGFDSIIDGRAAAGFYSIQPGGLLCWETRAGIAGCFRYDDDQAGSLRVKREDPANDADLGTVIVLAR
jgi:hypothetical protein